MKRRVVDILFCLQCDTLIPRGPYDRQHKYFCRACTSLRTRLNGRSAACAAVARAIREQRLSPASHFCCTDCGAPAQEYDHRDYSKPLDVEPVCRPCNGRRGPGRWTQFVPLPIHARRAIEFARSREVDAA